MPQTPHVEHPFTGSEHVRDIVIDMSDRLTVPFALGFSVVFTLADLLIFGYVKGRFTGTRPFLSAIQMALIGGLAAAAAYGLAKLIS